MTIAAGNIDPEGARNVSPEDRKRAQRFLDQGQKVFDTGNYEYAISMYINGLSWDPENMAAHQCLRDIALTRKMRGGKPIGLFGAKAPALPKAAKDDFKQQMLNAETLLSYDPGNTDRMMEVAEAAQKGSYFAVVRWIGPEVFRAIQTLPLPKQKAQFNQIIKLREVFRNSREFRSASEVCELAARLRPQDLDLVQEARQLATEETIKRGKYDQGGDFTTGLSNPEDQKRLMEAEKDVRDEGLLATLIREADQAYRANPTDAALLKKLVAALRKTEQMDNENRAIDLLEAKYEQTRQYSYRDEVNNIKLLQLARHERSEREVVSKDPNNAELRKQYQQFTREKTEEELRIFSERVGAYPTLMEAKYEMGKRLFALGRFDETIAIFQEVRNDPKYRVVAAVNLGRSFLESGFTQEAVETLAAVIADYPIKGDEKSKEMTYWYARSLELQGETQPALKSYSQVFQWDARYRDVQARIKLLQGRRHARWADKAGDQFQFRAERVELTLHAPGVVMTSSLGLYGQPLTLLNDLYQFTMAYGYWKLGVAAREAVFHLAFRKHPFNGGYSLACGLHSAIEFINGLRFDAGNLDYLGSLTGNDSKPLFDRGFLDYLAAMEFSCDVDAIPEGTVVFPHEPLIRVRGPILQGQILETPLLTLLNFQTLIATKAARVCSATGGEPVLEFGLRRAQGVDGGVTASRSAYVGGCAATSNLLAGKLFGIPVRGTHAHSWVMSFDNELDAFAQYARAMPNNCVFLVDTYDTLQGVVRAIEIGKRLRQQGHRMAGIRLDSGDLAWLSIQARRILDEAGFGDVAILASNDLDEHIIASLKQQGAKIGVWGVGTKLVTAYDQPALGGVYKLSALRDSPGHPWQYKLKLSEQKAKISDPGIRQVRRFRGPAGFIADAIYDEPTGIPEPTVIVDPMDDMRCRLLPAGTAHEDLLIPIFRSGRQVYELPTLEQVRSRAREQLAALDPSIKRLLNPHGYPVGYESGLNELKRSLILKARESCK